MKRVIINAYQIGMVIKNGVFEKMLTEGEYWIWNREVRVFDKTAPFIAPIDLNILLQNESFANTVTVIDVANTEIVLKYDNDILKEVLTEGKLSLIHI